MPLEHLADYTARLTDVFETNGTSGTWYAHASVGCLHVRPILNLRLEKDVKAMRTIAEQAFAFVREYKGSHSGEHGDGIVRSEFHEAMFGARLVRAFEEVKDRFDPDGSVQSRQDRARAEVRRPHELPLSRRTTRAHEMTTQLDWSAYPGAGGGFQGAVEMCNNNGACRASAGGVMCPSYRVTREERDSTRGRANTLRLAITGQLGPDAFTSDEMAETLKLCVSCKGCRRECPTGVDMARMKIEVQAARAAKYGLTLHDRLVGVSAALRALCGASCPWLLNLRDMRARRGETVGGDRGLQRAAHAAALALGCVHRPSQVVAAAGQARRRPPAGRWRGRAVRRHLQPLFRARESRRRATPCSSAGGYRVHVAKPADGSRARCAAAAPFSPSARSTRRAARPSARWLRSSRSSSRGVPVVGLEPSCLLSFRDEVPAMLKGEGAARLAELRADLRGVPGARGGSRPPASCR